LPWVQPGGNFAPVFLMMAQKRQAPIKPNFPRWPTRKTSEQASSFRD